MEELDQLFTKYGSDKTRNGYAPVYHSLFKNIRDKRLTLIEIGIGTMIPNVHSSMVGYALEGYAPGGSLRAWRDFFEHGDIHGIDVQADTQFTDEPRITTHLCDSTNLESVAELQNSEKFPKEADIILDDGSHWDENQLKTFTNLYPMVKKGGFYIIEDVNPGSRIMSDFLPKIREIAPDALVYGAFLKDTMHGRTPILIVSKR